MCATRPVFYECSPGGRAGLPTTPNRKVCEALKKPLQQNEENITASLYSWILCYPLSVRQGFTIGTGLNWGHLKYRLGCERLNPYVVL